ncbi:ankyrin [Lojkania enalia]|uniref:Ankyrin n=1 Tax=Lojkania enalia TaxID=147567 RepID=A0A9P4MVZ6_9PLEO|nr:ankyrin [Didymosphaeria enalia]
MLHPIKVSASVSAQLTVGYERHKPPLFAALANDSKEAIQIFLRAYSVNRPAERQLLEVYAQYILDRGREKELGDQVLFSLVFNKERTPPDIESLEYAVKNGRSVVVKLTPENGKFDYSGPMLSLAAKNGHNTMTLLSWAAGNRHADVVKLLLQTSKVDADLKDERGQTPLSMGPENGHKAVAQRLLEISKFDVNSKDDYGITPPLWVVWRRHEVAGKVDVDATHPDKCTRLLFAIGNGREVVAKLVFKTNKAEVCRERFKRNDTTVVSSTERT